MDKPSPYIEELISQKKSFVKVLRLMCLQCIASSGLKPKVLEGYKKELFQVWHDLQNQYNQYNATIFQVYGLEALLAVAKLEKIGLLKLQSSSRQYTVLRKALRLTMEDTSELNPTDISYVHSIYAPLSIRLCEQVTKNGGPKQLQDVLGLLPGIGIFLFLFFVTHPMISRSNTWGDTNFSKSKSNHRQFRISSNCTSFFYWRVYICWG